MDRLSTKPTTWSGTFLTIIFLILLSLQIFLIRESSFSSFNTRVSLLFFLKTGRIFNETDDVSRSSWFFFFGRFYEGMDAPWQFVYSHRLFSLINTWSFDEPLKERDYFRSVRINFIFVNYKLGIWVNFDFFPFPC